MHIMLQSSYNCNHRCWFCNEWSKTGRSWSKSECDIVVDKLSMLPDTINKIFIQFHGGEPTLCRYWEYIQYQLVDKLKDRQLFIQTQTNLSLSHSRLESFLEKIHAIRMPNHVIDINCSYHLGMQDVKQYARKLQLITPHVAYGGVQFIGEIVCQQEKTLDELKYLRDRFHDKICYRHVVINNPNITEIKEKYYKFNIKLNEHDSNFEYRYTLENYPELFSEYYPYGWLLKFNTELYGYDSIWSRYYISDLLRNMLGKHELYSDNKLKYDMSSEQVIDKLYVEAKNKYYDQLYPAKVLPRGVFCNSSSTGMCISSDLRVFNCLDYLHKNINGVSIHDINMKTHFLNKFKRCVLSSCNSCNFHILKRYW